MTVRLEGFHGTNNAHVDSILSKGLEPSLGDEEWLGDGGYFFVKGVNLKPEIQAEQWAIVQAWDNKNKKNTYLSYAVLRGDIEVEEEKFLDLTTAEGVGVLDYIQKQCISKLAGIGKKLSYIDGYLINFARGENLLDIEVAKGNFYIKLKKEDRVFRLSRRSPNCTICSVYDSQKNIVNIEINKKGRIEDEVRQ